MSGEEIAENLFLCLINLADQSEVIFLGNKLCLFLEITLSICDLIYKCLQFLLTA